MEWCLFLGFYSSSWINQIYVMIDPICLNKRSVMGAKGMSERRSYPQPTLSDDHILRTNSGSGILLEKRNEAEVSMNSELSLEKPGNMGKKQRSCASDVKGDLKTGRSSSHEIEKKLLTFEGKLFCFSDSFPANQVNFSIFMFL